MTTRTPVILSAPVPNDFAPSRRDTPRCAGRYGGVSSNEGRDFVEA
jgi:hypothetical protein